MSVLSKVPHRKRHTALEKKNGHLVKVDIACGNNKQPGFLGLDITKEGTKADKEQDLFTFPWPLESSSVDEFFCSHFFEHVPGKLRGCWMDEVWRCLKPGGFIRIITPYWTSNRSVQDFTHEWPPICQESYLYFTKEWRQANKLEHGPYALSCNFKIERADPAISEELTGKAQEAIMYAASHYTNMVHDLHVVLRKP